MHQEQDKQQRICASSVPSLISVLWKNSEFREFFDDLKPHSTDAMYGALYGSVLRVTRLAPNTPGQLFAQKRKARKLAVEILGSLGPSTSELEAILGYACLDSYAAPDEIGMALKSLRSLHAKSFELIGLALTAYSDLDIALNALGELLDAGVSSAKYRAFELAINENDSIVNARTAKLHSRWHKHGEALLNHDMANIAAARSLFRTSVRELLRKKAPEMASFLPTDKNTVLMPGGAMNVLEVMGLSDAYSPQKSSALLVLMSLQVTFSNATTISQTDPHLVLTKAIAGLGQVDPSLPGIIHLLNYLHGPIEFRDLSKPFLSEKLPTISKIVRK